MYCFVFWNHFISFYLNWIFFYVKRNIFQFWEQIFSWKNKVDTNLRLPPSHFNATGCRLWSTGSDRSQSSVVSSMQEGPGEIAVLQISRTEYMTKCYRNMVDQIPQKRIFCPKIKGNPMVYIGDLTFEIQVKYLFTEKETEMIYISVLVCKPLWILRNNLRQATNCFILRNDNSWKSIQYTLRIIRAIHAMLCFVVFSY